MTPQEHLQRAERLLAAAADDRGHPREGVRYFETMIDQAQVHATLALAGAVLPKVAAGNGRRGGGAR